MSFLFLIAALACSAPARAAVASKPSPRQRDARLDKIYADAFGKAMADASNADVKAVMTKAQMAAFNADIRAQNTYVQSACAARKDCGALFALINNASGFYPLVEQRPLSLSASFAYFDNLRRVQSMAVVMMGQDRAAFQPVFDRVTVSLEKLKGHILGLARINEDALLKQ